MRTSGWIVIIAAAAAPVMPTPARSAEPATSPAPPTTTPTTPTTPTEAPVERVETVEKLGDLVRVELRDRKLAFTLSPTDAMKSRLAANRPASFKIRGEDEEWVVQSDKPRDDADADGKDKPAAGGRTFAIACEERQNDRWSPLRLTTITGAASVGADGTATPATAAGQNVSLLGTGRAGISSVSVTFVQDATTGKTTFSVERARRFRARPMAAGQAADLVQLFNEHGPEVRQYLLPLLSEACGGENPLKPRAGDVYRAFPQIPADPAVTEKIRALLPELDADEASRRDAASAKLDALGRAGVLAAARIDPSDLTPEQASRLNDFITRNTLWPDPAVAAKRDPDFLIDCLEDTDPAARSSALSALRTVTRRELEIDVADATSTPRSRARAAADLRERLRRGDPVPAAGE